MTNDPMQNRLSRKIPGSFGIWNLGIDSGIRVSEFYRHLVFAILVAISLSTAARADWSLTTSDFQTQTVQLKSFSKNGAQIVSDDGRTSHIIAMDSLVSLSRPPADEPEAAKYTLILSNGDRLTGEPGSVTGEKLIWNNPLLKAVTIPFSRLVVIGKGNTAAVPDEPPHQDIVTLANGDNAAGVFTACSDGSVTLQTDNGPSTIPLASITRVAFASTASAAAKPDDARAFRIHFSDGSIFTVADVSTDADRVTLTPIGKSAQPISLPLVEVLGIDQLNGPVSWLSSGAPTENVQSPFLGGAATWPARFDQSVDGQPLSFDGKAFDHGIGVHAYSRLTFAIDPQWGTFRTQYAIDSHRDDPARFADVTVRIKLNGKTVHERAHVHAGDLSSVLSFDMNGATTLTLECDFGGAADTQAHLNWLEPALVRKPLVVAP